MIGRRASSCFISAVDRERLRRVVPTRLAAPALQHVSVRKKRDAGENSADDYRSCPLHGALAGFLPTLGRPSAVAFTSCFANQGDTLVADLPQAPVLAQGTRTP